MMDTLSHIFKEFSISGSVFFCETMHAPWEIPLNKNKSGSFHAVQSGSCRLIVKDEIYVLNKGDIAIILKDLDHRLSDNGSDEGMSKDRSSDPQETLIMCGHFEMSYHVGHPLFEYFPNCFIIRDEELSHNPWLRATLDHMINETQSGNPGAELSVNRLTEVIFIQFLRHYLEAKDHKGVFIKALYDPKIGKALNLLYSNPSYQWTIEGLAQQVGMSRAAFSNRFTKLVGQSVYVYLSGIRMRLACRYLRETEISVINIAEKIGYLSDTAFNRAFKKHQGISALKYRQREQIS